MPRLTPIPLATQREERWTNGTGSTRVIWRDPDSAAWRVRVSVARVDADGPFSELPDTRRTLVPLDAPIALAFADGSTHRAERLQALCFAGAPAATGHLPAGPTRDFNLMLRGAARGEVTARTLAGPTVLPAAVGTAWLLYLATGHATVEAGAGHPCALAPGDAVHLAITAPAPPRTVLAGTGEILCVKLYA